MRQQFKMSQEQLVYLLHASKPVEAIALQCGPISSPRENANRAWQALGSEMGFDWETVQPAAGMSIEYFTAVPTQK